MNSLDLAVVSKSDIIIDITKYPTYYEVSQNNPLRWKPMLRNAEGLFEEQAGWMKCKDFFNDLVARRKQDKAWEIYGFKNDIKFNDEGLYILLNNVTKKELFVKNIEVMNKRLQADIGCEIELLDTEHPAMMIALVPNEVWHSTYRVSAVTGCIRLCNYNYTYGQWEDFWNHSAPSYTSEKNFDDLAKKNLLKNGFKVAEQYADYWFYGGEQYNSKTLPNAQGAMVHNNGVSTWSYYVGVMEVA
jgi:hypothetical protein